MSDKEASTWHPYTSAEEARLFKTYQRTKVERKIVTVVTEENIAALAAYFKCVLSYERDLPELLVTIDHNKPWRIPIGYELSVIDGKPVNANGFNRHFDWEEVD